MPGPILLRDALPCPFCGGVSQFTTRRSMYVGCYKCNVWRPTVTDWNRRVDPSDDYVLGKVLHFIDGLPSGEPAVRDAVADYRKAQQQEALPNA